MIAVLVGCHDTESVQPIDQTKPYLDRSDFIAKTIASNRVVDYNKLSGETQKSFWIDKLNQIQKMAISEEQSRLILTASKLLSSDTKFSELERPLLDIGYDLSLVSSEDFYRSAFMSLQDISPDDFRSTVGKYTEHANDIRNGIGYFHVLVKDNNNEGDEKPSCNCNWSCDAVETIDPCLESEKGCEPTSRGCGFLGFGGCYRQLVDKCIPG